MTRWPIRVVGIAACLAAIGGGIVYMATSGKPDQRQPQLEAQAGSKLRSPESPTVSKPSVGAPVAPKGTAPQAGGTPENTMPAWTPGDPVRVRPDLRKSGESGSPAVKPGDQK